MLMNTQTIHHLTQEELKELLGVVTNKHDKAPKSLGILAEPVQSLADGLAMGRGLTAKGAFILAMIYSKRLLKLSPRIIGLNMKENSPAKRE